MDLLSFIIGLFTTREWASITLIILFVLLSAKAKSVRESIIGVVKAFFHWKILLPIICAQIYLSIFAYALYKYGLWNTTILRETIFFLFYTSIALILKYNNDDERISSIKGIVEDTVKATLIIEFYLNIHTFSYGVELIFQFLLALLFLIGAYNKRDTKELHKAGGCALKLFYCLSVFLLTYSIYMSIDQWRENFMTQNVVSLLFPIAATIAYWPFLYIFSVVKVYEEWFVRIYFASNKEEYGFRKKQVFKACGINLSLIHFVSKNFHVYIPQTQKQFVDDLNKSVEKYKTNKI
ncbi:MAG: hypothetical protein IJJ98_13455 [Prevotella sp.]|nr:hypothetical protein [Prevotella sp.]